MSETSPTTREPDLRLSAIGDIGLYKKVPQTLEKLGVEAFCADAAEVLADADLRFANVEIPLVAAPGGQDDFSLAGPREAVSVLSRLGIDVACLANNHVLDAGWEGALETREALENEGIKTFGIGESLEAARRPLVVTAAGLRVGFLGYAEGVHGKHRHVASATTPGVAPLDGECIAKDVAALSAVVDLIVLSLHWGVNYVPFAMPEQRELGARAVAAGADVILGHHPHVPQGVEYRDGRPVAYSLGDFIFDWRGGNVTNEEATERRRRTGVLHLERRDASWSHRWTPIHQAGDHRPIVVREDADEHLAALEALDRYYTEEGAYPEDPWAEAGRIMGNHASRVLAYHLRRGNFGYLAGKLLRIRPRHMKLIRGWLGRRQPEK